MTTTTDQPENAKGLETDKAMDTDDVLKQADKLSRADNRTIQNYFFIIVLGMFMVLFFLQWRQNSASPDKLITILESNSKANSENLKLATDSLKVQEKSLDKITEFAIRVPMEHSAALTEIKVNGETLSEMKTEQAELRSAVKANTEAVQKNTEAVARLISAIEVKIDGTPKNQPAPPMN